MTELPDAGPPRPTPPGRPSPVSGQEGGPRVWLVPTPVGNLGDITLRAVEVLKGADAVACEDTRRSGALLSHLGIQKPLVRLDAHTMRRAPAVLDKYPRLAYVSDAGTPGVSDPGAELVAAALAADVPVEVLPGATAFVPALVLSGLDTARFTFEGFLPRSGRERKTRLVALAARPETTVLYESPHRLGATLGDLAGACGETRPASVTRELSKKFEETARGTLGELAVRFAAGVRGEIVVVVGGRPTGEADPDAPAPDHEALAQEWAGQGKTSRDIRDLLMAQGLRKNDAYALALRVTGGA
ncbi:16S rRNA (cytidine(1402)-2'-O)-methyltransferase [Deinococcus radiopugnans]|uniref:Ribosomal RNA small subunit methyltransferase I n=1 Tax=Deinococcus radiopugnans ATCC 19172 TaxID=585398 RepID=A0A5C4YAK6_9DEIO|nr:16S rRNA (cytidine(1402)-2'-O)-methyltransferase [Deinococcus radiopugnans]MBB6016150.1 16S rRNA (cytidine1402-2'-O)-methyltransferase [Deinococcus radiopugnans ATCC 19172]TNM72172.1 16S rRNA (cytidine(1402)-2'-O)-methyltransferase [Deinococcus radiopugnans ATCC 19172]